MAALTLYLAASALVANTKYTLHFDKAAVDATGKPLYVRDSEVASTIPGFARLGTRIDSCYQSMTNPNFLNLSYLRSVTAPHTANTNKLTCAFDRNASIFLCQIVPAMQVAFGDDPSKYFRLEKNTNRDDALAIFKAYNDGSMKFAPKYTPWIASLKITEITREGAYYILNRNDCGCSNPIKAELKRKLGASTVTAMEDVGGSCT